MPCTVFVLRGRPSHNICPSVPDKWSLCREQGGRMFKEVQTWLLIVALAALCPPFISTAALVWSTFTASAVCCCYYLTYVFLRYHPPTLYSHEPAESELLDYCAVHDQRSLSWVNTQQQHISQSTATLVCTVFTLSYCVTGATKSHSFTGKVKHFLLKTFFIQRTVNMRGQRVIAGEVSVAVFKVQSKLMQIMEACVRVALEFCVLVFSRTRTVRA